MSTTEEQIRSNPQPDNAPRRSDTSPSAKALPRIRTEHTSDEILDRVAKLSQRGRLPGFAKSDSDVLFVATAFGQPFDRVLEARLSRSGNGTELAFATRLKPMLPWTFALVTAFTVWPGVWLTDSLLTTYFEWYQFATWMWYLPVTVLPLPWAIRAIMRKSEAAAAESALDLIERVREVIEGTTREA